jgi:hypothetical protein
MKELKQEVKNSNKDKVKEKLTKQNGKESKTN